MFIIDEETGNITIRQGDSAEITITGIPDDREYDVYFSMYDSNRNILFEIKEKPVDKEVTFKIKPIDSEKLIVPVGQKTAQYFWGVKRCYKPDNFEDTLIVGNKAIGDLNKVLVYPLTTEGDENAES